MQKQIENLLVSEGKKLIDRLEQERCLNRDDLAALIAANSTELREYAGRKARAICDTWYGKDIYIRGLIEFTNYCKNDCYYCGIRRSNSCAVRYRLREEEILSCCREGPILR